MRILFLNYEYPPLGGGAANATQYLLREWGHMSDMTVDLVTSAVDNRATREILPGSDGRITIYRVPIGDKTQQKTYQSQADLLRYAWRGTARARQLMQSHRYDCVLAFFGVPCGAMAWLLTRGTDIPYIVSLRGSDVPGFSERFAAIYNVLTPLIRFVWRHAAAVIANSDGLRALALRTAPQQSIEVILNGIDCAQFTPEATQESRKTDEPLRLLCGGRLMHRKGFIYAIDAVAHLVEKGVPIHLTLAGGDGDAAEELRSAVVHHGIQKHVTFRGYVSHDDFPALYRTMDVFVFPSLNEGMSNSLLEALASGLPVIVTPTGGSEELVTAGKNGFVIPFRDSVAIAQAVERLAQDHSLRQRMGRESRAVAERFNWERVAQAYRQTCHHICTTQ